MRVPASICFGSMHRSAEQENQQLHGDLVHHHRAQDFVDVETRLEEAGDRAPERSGEEADDQRQRGEQPRRKRSAQAERERRRRDRADEDLPLRADIDHAGAKGDADADGDDQQRRGAGQRAEQRGLTAERAVDHGAVSFNRVRAEDQQQHAAGSERQQDGDDGSEGDDEVAA